MAHIGLTGAGEKPARFANKRTVHRPLSNPAAPSAQKLVPLTYAGPSPLALKRQEQDNRTHEVMAFKCHSTQQLITPVTVNDLLTVTRPWVARSSRGVGHLQCRGRPSQQCRSGCALLPYPH